MSKALRTLFVSVAVIAAVTIPACKSKKTPPPKVSPAEVIQPPPIVMPPPPPVTDTAPKVPVDFVQPTAEPTVTSQTLPANLDDANRVAQERRFLQDAFFGYDESALSNDAQTALSSSATWLKQNPQYSILVEGHCDERGTEQYNLALGDRRANIVKQYLQTLGIDASRMRTVSYGEERPFDAGHDESSWATNRRAHLVIVGR